MPLRWAQACRSSKIARTSFAALAISEKAGTDMLEVVWKGRLCSMIVWCEGGVKEVSLLLSSYKHLGVCWGGKARNSGTMLREFL
jgi:hypothetical protein